MFLALSAPKLQNLANDFLEIKAIEDEELENLRI